MVKQVLNDSTGELLAVKLHDAVAIGGGPARAGGSAAQAAAAAAAMAADAGLQVPTPC